MLSLGQVKVGAKIIYRQEPHVVLLANHLKVGRGGAKLVTKLRNLVTHAVYDFTFSGDERLEEAEVGYRKAQFLYADAEGAFFMTQDTFETLCLKLEPKRISLLKEGQEVDLLLWKSQPLDIILPPKVSLVVTYTEPGFKGNTTSSTLKNATLETGAEVMVPLFINVKDRVLINTDTASYDGRDNS